MTKKTLTEEMIQPYRLLMIERAFGDWCRDFAHRLPSGECAPIVCYTTKDGEEVLSEQFLHFLGGFLYAEPNNGYKGYYKHLDRVTTGSTGTAGIQVDMSHIVPRETV